MKNSELRTAADSRIIRGAWLAALVLLTSGFWIPSASASSVASIVAIEPARVADLVLLQGGFDAGLRQGMVCRVTRGSLEVAEILLVELRPTCSAALILNIAPKQSIHAGDVARIKVLKT